MNLGLGLKSSPLHTFSVSSSPNSTFLFCRSANPKDFVSSATKRNILGRICTLSRVEQSTNMEKPSKSRNLEIGSRVIRNHFHNRLFSSFKRPTYSYISISSVCNSHCKYCDIWKNKGEDEPTDAEWKGIISEMPRIGISTVTFSGGEPFIREDLFELAKYAKSQGMATTVVTNFSFFEENQIEEISDSFDFVGISIDSTRPEIYTKFRGVDWLEKTKSNVHKLMDGLIDLKSKTQVCGMTVISNENAYEMHELIHMIFDELMMDSISFNLVDPNGGMNAKELLPTPKQIDYVRKTILEHKSLYPVSNTIRCISQLGNFNYKCNPWKCVQIDHKGYLSLPCAFYSLKPEILAEGNKISLLEQKLSDVWMSRQTQTTFSKYSNCKMCNLGCVAESAWTTYDLGFLVKEIYFGLVRQTMTRIAQRNRSNRKT